MDLINAKAVSITSSFVESKVQFYIKLLFVVLHFTVRMHLGMQKTIIPAQLLLLIFPEEILTSHALKAKKFKI